MKGEDLNAFLNRGVSSDETWLRRGHSSLNRRVTVLSIIDAVKCLNVQVLTKVCHACQRHETNSDFKQKCQINHAPKCKAMHQGAPTNNSFGTWLSVCVIVCNMIPG